MIAGPATHQKFPPNAPAASSATRLTTDSIQPRADTIDLLGGAPKILTDQSMIHLLLNVLLPEISHDMIIARPHGSEKIYEDTLRSPIDQQSTSCEAIMN